ncbi:MAG: hypothetical protein IPN90_05825 [Elusimicrobia bacterium]|nr:hypothetical protein [Elusimicrobiota bacterium]
MIDVLGQTAGRPQQYLESKINATAEIPPTRLDREEFIMNQPRRGQLTCRVAVHRARYDGDVRRDLLNKKNRALEDARRAHTALEDGRLADALSALDSLQSRADADFPNLSLEGDADGDGKPEDVLVWARSRQGEIRNSLTLTCAPGPFIFGDDGRFAGAPTARLSWSGPGSVSLDGIPLRARWTHRPDHTADRKLTAKNGEVVFHPRVDLFVESSFLQVELDANSPITDCRSAFHRRRQALVFVGADREDVRVSLEQETVSRLKRFPWDVSLVNEEEISAGGGTTIRLDAHTKIVRYPEGDIHRAHIVFRATICSGGTGKSVFQGESPVLEGFGVSPADAVRVALETLKENFSPWLDEKVKGLP